MNTGYVDLFFVHSVSNIKADISDKTRKWAEAAKSQGKIRFFGFSTHSNMDECLLGAAKLGWIDGIMMTYNFRLMDTDEMKRAMDACHNAGIGLTAMKTQGSRWGSTGLTDTDTGRAARFLSKGFTEEQARLMAVWENPQVASICSQMPNLRILKANREAALAAETGLSAGDRNALRLHAAQTKDQYCAGCTRICQSVLPPDTPVGDIMRCLMYQKRLPRPGPGPPGVSGPAGINQTGPGPPGFCTSPRALPPKHPHWPGHAPGPAGSGLIKGPCGAPGFWRDSIRICRVFSVFYLYKEAVCDRKSEAFIFRDFASRIQAVSFPRQTRAEDTAGTPGIRRRTGTCGRLPHACGDALFWGTTNMDRTGLFSKQLLPEKKRVIHQPGRAWDPGPTVSPALDRV